jgi:hypothetical protein
LAAIRSFALIWVAAKSRRNTVLQHRSHTTRSFRAGTAWLAGAALSIAAVVGCHNNSERDLIARDRRMQEDQIYALQDYISQYQQLVCRYRSENESLRRKLSDGRVAEPEPEPSEPRPRTRDRSSAPTSTPQFQAPQTPSSEEQSPPPPAPPVIEAPDVPPLKTTTTGEAALTNDSLVSEVAVPDDSSPRVLVASHDETTQNEASGETASAAGEPGRFIANEPTAPAVHAQSDSAINVMLSGEVVANDAGGGPRLMVDVVPFDASGRVEAFDGSVSLMLLTSGDDGRQRSIGRWDFGPNDVRAAIDTSASEPTIRFFVELPAGAAVSEATQLWVRLVPRDGAKLLAYANVDLAQPGVFSSRTDKLWPTEEAVLAASYVEESSTPASDVATTMSEGDWAIAEPGKPANLPPEAQDSSGGGGWRLSTEPMPAVVASSTALSPPPAIEPLVRHENPTPVADAARPAKRPGWSPERSGESARRVATRPNWSATR